MTRSAWIWLSVALCTPGLLTAQGDTVARRHDVTLQDVPRATSRRATVHYGKWLTAGAVVTFTLMAAHEHRFSRRDWDELMAICRSADDACARGSDGRYARTDAELAYQRSLFYDRRANRRLLGAQASLLVTAALFILDLRRGDDGPDNIPFAPLRVSVEPATGAARVGFALSF